MAAPDEPALAIGDLSVAYGKVVAVRRASFQVARGEVVALIGPNSAGKTSMALGIAAQSRRRQVTGEVSVRGRRIGGLGTAARWAAGLRLVPQGREIFPRLSVEDNLRVVADHLQVGWSEAIAQARDLFPRVFIERAGTAAGNLSGGEQQMLALARALLGEPQVLLLDEPGLGLARGVVTELARVVAQLRERGMGILLIDQNFLPWSAVVDRALVMVRGEIVGSAADAQAVNRILGHH